MGFKTGDTEMFMWSETEKELFKLNSDKIDEHEDELMSIDMLESKGLFVTGGRDGLVKVWNIKKQLIREIKFPEPITSVCFFNAQGDILVGHIGKVSSVMAKDYKPFEQKELSQPTPLELEAFMNQPTRIAASEFTFKKLKKQDDDIRKQLSEIMKRKAIQPQVDE